MDGVNPTRLEPVSPETDADAASDPVIGFAHDTLRENLHLAMNSVISQRFRDPRVREALTVELLTVVDQIVDDHIAAEELGRRMHEPARDAPPDSPGATATVEGTMAGLKERVQAVLGVARPGLRQGASAAMKVSPLVVDAFTRFLHDEAALAQAERAAQVLLSRYVHPLIAGRIVSFAAAAARRGARTSSVTGAADESPLDAASP